MLRKIGITSFNGFTSGLGIGPKSSNFPHHAHIIIPFPGSALESANCNVNI